MTKPKILEQLRDQALFRIATPNDLGYLYRCREVRYAPPLDEYEHPMGEGRVEVVCHRFRILRRTPKGAWIDNYGEPKFVLLQAYKKFACETQEEARSNFIARKHKQARILNSQLRTIEKAMNLAKNKEVRNAF